MQTYTERVDFVIKKKESSRSKLAAVLGIPQQTFNSYFHARRSNALLALSGRICDIWPDVSRRWLETGEGEIYQTEQHSAEEYATLKAELDAKQAENERLRSELDEERRLNRTLTAKLLIEGRTEGSAASSAKSADRQK